VVCLRPTGARRHNYVREHGLDEDGGFEDATPENVAPASSETFRQGARAQDLPRLQAGQAAARPLILTET
jgi:hypothetical protein